MSGFVSQRWRAEEALVQADNVLPSRDGQCDWSNHGYIVPLRMSELKVVSLVVKYAHRGGPVATDAIIVHVFEFKRRFSDALLLAVSTYPAFSRPLAFFLLVGVAR